MAFKKATKASAWLRLAITGPSGSGKTFTALAVAEALVPGGRVAVVDTEHGSASLYSDRFAFDVSELDDFEPKNYVDAIRDAVRERYDVVVLDSLSHAWMGAGGILDQLDNASRNFNAWKNLTPQQNKLIDAIIRADIHVIATMRSKQEYVVDKDAHGKITPRKLGMAAIQRDGTEYEFSAVLDLDMDHVARASKTRCPGLDGKAFRKPGADVARILREWLALDGGAPAPNPAPSAKQPETTNRSASVIVAAEMSRGAMAERIATARETARAATEQPSVTERARKAFASAADARALIALAPNVLRVPEGERTAVAESYRDRWIALATGLDAAARKRVLHALGGMPAEVWELCDWQALRALLGGEDAQNGAGETAPDASVTDY